MKIPILTKKYGNGLTYVGATIKGPIYSTHVYIPTRAFDNSGLPHTLEHLVFCGSKSYPERGILDRLASLCQSTGTNAYTAEDHTCYTFSTSSKIGLLKMLPVFLDHIFHPTLDPDVCLKEVFHCVKSTGRQESTLRNKKLKPLQPDLGTTSNVFDTDSGFDKLNENKVGRGVVYCEMQAREWSEADLLDRALRRNVMSPAFISQIDPDPNLKCYRWEHGGLTREICRLTRDQIAEYHNMYYRHENAVILICGPNLSDIDEILESATNSPMNNTHPSDHPHQVVSSTIQESLPVPVSVGAGKNSTETKCNQNEPITSVLNESSYDDSLVLSENIHFPSSDLSIGSVGFAWAGPPSRDMHSISALHVLMRMLRDTSASPLYQHFVETKSPVACDIEYEIKPLRRTIITLIFSGVNTATDFDCPIEDQDIDKAHKLDTNFLDPQLSDHETDEVDTSESSSEGEVHDSQETDSLKKNWLKSNEIKSELLALIHTWLSNDTVVEERAKTVLKSIHNKFTEQMEEDPHEAIASYCAPEIVARSWPADYRGEVPEIGEGINQVTTILTDLSGRKADFWRSLAREYLLDSNCVEAILHPSREMSDLIKEWEAEQLKNIPTIKIDVEKLDSTFCQNDVDVVSILGNVDGSNDNGIKYSTEFNSRNLSISVHEAAFDRYVALFDLSRIHENFRHLVVIFQELLMQCNLHVNLSDNVHPLLLSLCDSNGFVPYQKLIEALADKFTLFEASVGFGNSIFACDYLDSHLVFSACQPASLNCDFSDIRLVNPTLPREDVKLSPCWNLGHSIFQLMHQIIQFSHFEVNRVGEVLENLATQVRESWRDPGTVMDAHLTWKLENIKVEPENLPCKRHRFSSKFKKYNSDFEYNIGIMSQGKFLLEVAALKGEAKVQRLNEIAKEFNILVSNILQFDGICCFSSSMHEKLPTAKDTISSPVYTLPKYGFLEGIRLPRIIDVIPMEDITSSFISFSTPIDLYAVDGPSRYGENIHSRLPQDDVNHRDSVVEFGSLRILCQLMSFTEGPLWQRIRGAGLAYDASLSLAIWSGLLTVSISDSADPAAAIRALKSLIEDILVEARQILETECDSGNKIIRQEALMTARSIQKYHFVLERSTPGALTGTAIRSTLRGFPPLGSEEEQELFLESIDADKSGLVAVANAALKYLPRVLDTSLTIGVVTVPASSAETVVKSLSELGLGEIYLNSNFCLNQIK